MPSAPRAERAMPGKTGEGNPFEAEIKLLLLLIIIIIITITITMTIIIIMIIIINGGPRRKHPHPHSENLSKLIKLSLDSSRPQMKAIISFTWGATYIANALTVGAFRKLLRL